MRWAVLLATATGCQQLFGLDRPQQVTHDASEDIIDSPTIDAPPPTSCIQRWLDDTFTLTVPFQVNGINTAGQERNPFVIAAGSSYELYFTRDADLYVAAGGPDTFDQV